MARFERDGRARARTLRGSVSAVAVAFAGAALAQEAPPPPPADSGQQLERIVVTGSNIRRTDEETPSPVQIVTAKDLAQSGYTSIADVLHNITANNMGSLSQANASAFAAGGSGVSLRGLTVGATLVLIDGHRMASYPIPDDGERDFVDISSIPFDVIERIEVLKDGASAVYGSDAMAGVVNIILKKTFKGIAAGAEYGTSYKGDGSTVHANLTYGWGDLAGDGSNTYASIEYRHQDSILWSSRPYLYRTDWTPWGGLDLTPGNGNLPGPVDPFLQIQPSTQHTNVLARHTRKIFDDWQLSVAASMFDSIATQVGVFNSSTNPGSLTIPATTVSFVPGQPIALNNYGLQVYPSLFSDLGPQTQRTDTVSTRLVADLAGTIGAWDVQAALGYTHTSERVNFKHFMSFSRLVAAINNGSYVPGGNNPGSVVSSVTPEQESTSTNELEFASLRGSRDILPLGGGNLALGTGVEVIHRAINEQFPYSFETGDQPSSIYSFVIGKQNVYAAYAELVAPVLKGLEFDAAARLDHFDTYGNSFTPKGGFKWTPLQSLTLRGTVARGFRAPNPAEIGNGGSTSGILAQVYDPVLCASGDPNTPPVINPSQCAIYPPGLQISAKHLNPERSRSYTLGVIFEPTQSFNGSLDYYNIRISDQIVSVGQFGQSYYNNPSAYGAILYRGAPIGTDPVGPILYSTYPFINANTTQTSGVDLDLRYKLDLQDAGKFTVELQNTFVFEYAITTADGTKYELAGTHGPAFVSGDTGSPRDRAQLSFTWERRGIEARIDVNRISAFGVTDPSYGIPDCATSLAAEFGGAQPPAGFCSIPAFTTVNVQGSYEIDKNWSVHGSITNLLNKHAPFDLQTFGAAGNGAPTGGAPYNPALHQDGAIGTFFNAGFSYRF